MRLRFWRRPKLTKPEGLSAGDIIYAAGIPRDATPPPGWTWDEHHGWHKTVSEGDES